MPVKIQKRLQVLSLIERAREDFKKELKPVIAQEIIKTLESGNNPIKAGKQEKYSQSYIDQIEGRKKFFHGKGGGTYVVEPKLEHGDHTSLKISKSGKVSQGKEKKAKRMTFEKGLGHGKLKSPVNLKVRGVLHSYIRTGFTPKGIEVFFADPKVSGSNYTLSEIHNNIGVGPNKTKRRLLPNLPGEKFNTNIFRRIIDALKKAVKKNM